MKLATYAGPQGRPTLGLVDTERGSVLDLAAASAQLRGSADPALTSMLALIEAGPDALATVRALAAEWPDKLAAPLASVRLFSPLPVPPQMRDCLVFEQHLINAQSQWEKMTGKPAAGVPDVWYQRPTWYKCNRFSFVGHEAEVVWPPYAELMDFECELACVIGRRGANIPAHAARDHIFGLTIFNDFSARDIQVVERPLGMGPMKGKDFDTGNVLGPWIVTMDEIGDPHALAMEARVNGERWGGGNSSMMHHTFDDILAFISQSETLHPGELIASGTVPTGCGLELGRFLQSGDVVELEIEKIGVLRNRILRH
jgi:2-keto-4-pentenoate hydratase/2-oxohepta-3-ene-1,7-dioic acid hydratase in catechol pathway